jgi:hypothetical protein
MEISKDSCWFGFERSPSYLSTTYLIAAVLFIVQRRRLLLLDDKNLFTGIFAVCKWRMIETRRSGFTQLAKAELHTA